MSERLIRCIIWFLGLILVIAFLDATPDPPALVPHGTIVKVPGPRECAEGLGGQVEFFSAPSPLSLPQVATLVTHTELDTFVIAIA
jgi:hypothetical protein